MTFRNVFAKVDCMLPISFTATDVAKWRAGLYVLIRGVYADGTAPKIKGKHLIHIDAAKEMVLKGSYAFLQLGRRSDGAVALEIRLVNGSLDIRVFE